MPIFISDRGDVIGSVVYEQVGTHEMTLEFYSSTTIQPAKGKTQVLDYPQAALQQEWAISYPIIAYKHYQPGNHKICIINTAQNSPQKVIDIGEWEFVHFVQHT
jgi:hypothetical protein